MRRCIFLVAATATAFFSLSTSARELCTLIADADSGQALLQRGPLSAGDDPCCTPSANYYTACQADFHVA